MTKKLLFSDHDKKTRTDLHLYPCTAATGGLVLAERGKHVYDVSSNSDKECITTLITVNAAGDIAPPLTLYAYERLPKTAYDKAPTGWGIGKTENGWMTSAAFYEYFTNVFYPYLLEQKIEFPVIVFLDRHGSHLSYHLSEFCSENQIVVACLPPNTTHMMQPLDVSFFAPMKKKWCKMLKTWRINHDGIDLQKFDIPVALFDILREENFKKSITAGFKCCGLYPFDVEGVNYNKCVKQSKVAASDAENRNNSYQLNNESQKALATAEKHIDNDILNQFKNVKKFNTEWKGDIQYFALYNMWSGLFDEAQGNIYEKDQNSTDSAIMEVSDSPTDLPVTENSDFQVMSLEMNESVENEVVIDVDGMYVLYI